LQPASFRDWPIGVAAGTVFVFAINQARLLALFFSVRSHPAWFGPLHGLTAPLGVVVLVVLAWPWRAVSELAVRMALAAALVVAVVLLDVPLILVRIRHCESWG
jgi:hypothetical protein